MTRIFILPAQSVRRPLRSCVSTDQKADGQAVPNLSYLCLGHLSPFPIPPRRYGVPLSCYESSLLISFGFARGAKLQDPDHRSERSISTLEAMSSRMPTRLATLKLRKSTRTTCETMRVYLLQTNNPGFTLRTNRRYSVGHSWSRLLPDGRHIRSMIRAARSHEMRLMWFWAR